MVRENPDAQDLSENSGNPAFAHPNLCPALMSIALTGLRLPRAFVYSAMIIINRPMGQTLQNSIIEKNQNNLLNNNNFNLLIL